jgi:hypothetical protein
MTKNVVPFRSKAGVIYFLFEKEGRYDAKQAQPEYCNCLPLNSINSPGRANQPIYVPLMEVWFASLRTERFYFVRRRVSSDN